MKQDQILTEAKRLHDLGFAVHLLHPKSKRPIESGWTVGPRKSWKALETNYRPGMNVGVRLGAASKIKDKFLSVIDVDVKSGTEAHRKEVEEKLKSLIGPNTLPVVSSGRGNGSRHYYILTKAPALPFKAAQSLDTVKVSMPSVVPSKKERKLLTLKELESGLRLRPAWEIAVMGEGQQVVLPPSIHPDSGKAYNWKRPFNSALALKFNNELLKKPEIEARESGAQDVTFKKQQNAQVSLSGFVPEAIELSWLPIDAKIRAMIMEGEGVEDRSAMLLPVAHALVKAGLTQNEVLSILTDPETFMGKAAYEHAQTKNRMRAANWLYRYTVKKAFDESSAKAIFAAPFEIAVKQTVGAVEEQQKAFDDEFDWRLDLDISKNDSVRTTLKNVVLILRNEIGVDFIRRDTFATREFYAVDVPWGSKAGEIIKDEHMVFVKLWLSQKFKVEPSTHIVSEAFKRIAKDNSFDPVIDWLEALPAWDGIVRLDSWLKNNFEAEGPKEYLAQVFRKWLVAMVARALSPGFKFDWMPIFEGAQGVGKSSFGRLLCGDEYFLDSLPDLANKDSVLALQGIWVVEFGELASFRKNEIEIVKGFLTRTVDKVRPPYGMRWEENPRRCVFFGTTNHETYLRDDTGNRRFKPVKVGNLDFEALKEDRKQLFAEALWLFKTGFEGPHTLELSGEASEYEAKIQTEKMVADESVLMAEKVRAFIDEQNGAENDLKFPLEKFKISDLFSQGRASKFLSLPLENWRFDSRNVQFASKALKALGFKNWKSDGTKYWKNTKIGMGFL